MISRKIELLTKITRKMNRLQLQWARLLKHKQRVFKVNKWK